MRMFNHNTNCYHVIEILILAIALTAASAPEANEVDPETLQMFKKGVELFKAGKFNESAVVFESAYEMKPSYKLFFNIGQAYAASKKFDRAIEAFELYIVKGGDDIPRARRDQVLNEIEKIKPLIGYLKVKADSGLDLRVDGEHRGKTPIKLMLTVGIPHKIEILSQGKLVYSHELKVFSGTTEVLQVKEQGSISESQTAPKESGMPLQSTGETKKVSSLKITGWVALSTGAALLATGGIVGGIALNQSDTLEDVCPNYKCSPAREKSISGLDSLALTADILFGVGGAALAAGIVLLVLPDKKTEGEAAVGVVPVPGGLVANVRF